MLEGGNILKYKLSKYNYKLFDENGGMFIFNTLYKTTLRTNKSSIIQFINDFPINYMSESSEQEKIIQKLIAKKILVPNDYDENKIADLRYYNIVYGSDMLRLTIIPTYRCNFKCIYCYEDLPQPDMTMETANRIIKYVKKHIHKYSYLFVNWFGGEPMISFDLVLYIMAELKIICIENRVVLLAAMTSNVSLITPEKLIHLLNVGISLYQISVDGTEIIHNKQRPFIDNSNSNSYQCIMDNLLSIRDIVKNKRFEIGIRINITKEIDAHMDNILNYFKKEFSGNPRFSMIFEWVRDWGGEINKDLPTSANICLAWIEKASKIGLRCGDILSNACGVEFCEACKNQSYMIDSDGSLKKCTIAIYDETNSDLNTVGYLDEKGNDIVDQNKLSKWISRDNPKKSCYDCVIYPMCMSVNCPWSTQVKGIKACHPIKSIIPSSLLNKAQFIDYE